MEGEEHETYDEYDVDETSGDVKGEKPKQPKNDQYRCDYPKHVFNSFYLGARAKQRVFCRAQRRCRLLVGSVLVGTRLPD
jgi:hypothetical protein